MPILNVPQPDIIEVNNEMRLRKYDECNEFALKWYQDEETLMLVDGRNEPYDREGLNRMYSYLNEHGELYFIEMKCGGEYRPIGDVTFMSDDMPIVIGDKEYRGKGIGKKIIAALIERAKILGYREILVKEIYRYNIGSQKLFESMGFRKQGETSEGYSYRLDIK